MNEPAKQARPPEELPMAAPCRRLPTRAPLDWLARGWVDLRRAPRQSLSWGAVVLALSYLITAATWRWGNLGLYLGLVSGFVFIGPWLAMTLYAISRRLELDRGVSLRRSIADAGQSIRGAMVFAVILIIVLLVWARAANTLYIFFPALANPGWRDLLLFLTVGSAVGAVFSAVVFAVSAFSLPMLMDRRADAVTAVITSINAVLRNKRTMLLWAAIIVSCVLLGAATAWLGFLILIPLLGHATWHAYRDTIDASEWPARPPVDFKAREQAVMQKKRDL
ncbi:DUF2189 domain-containing protein [Wenzhouxiangella marina]|uniref:Integral membrane protein n=1 Tax=Wenzhouxiangella marina TaxID=1579979 RepID=A0A0K0XSG1_9GAMM|nr:DUF2189 domain-containing protein [Wenzhouxiangella marina]AKS40649.1 Integral membrane protein [Wenzhouxiangella marina]MBB6088419.1 putative membrane protein [Wenzhouxiangella marina]